MTHKPVRNLTSFAIGIYSLPGVATACLQMQSAGQDVCLLLCAAWLYRLGVAWTPVGAEQLRAASHPWQSAVVTPLRELRHDWKDAAASDGELCELREQVKRLELKAEMVLLQRLETIALPWLESDESEGVESHDWLTEMASEAGSKNPAELQLVRASAAAQ